MNIIDYGWDDYFNKQFESMKSGGQFVGRIIREDRGQYKIFTDSGVFEGEISGKLHFRTVLKEEYPVTGDWVIVTGGADGKLLIHGVLKRKNEFSRKESGNSSGRQILAVNIDTLFIMTSLNLNYNLRRIERYLILAKSSGAAIVLLLSKSDLEPDIDAKIDEVKAVSAGAGVIAISAVTGRGMDELAAFLKPGSTAAIFGSSGVGKSTLINRLLGNEALKTNEIRESDGEGRHTTTWRELIVLSNGAIIMDTPGLREVGITRDHTDIDEAFDDISMFAKECKFRDCTHTNEPGCAVQNAMETGDLDRKRFDGYIRLLKENKYYERKENSAEKQKDRRKWKNISKIQKRMKRDGG